MKKKIIIFIGIVTALSIVITPVFAQDSRNIKSKIIYQFVDNIIDNGTEEVLGLEVMYLITYENQLLALSNFRNEYFKEFHFIQEKYNLPT